MSPAPASGAVIDTVCLQNFLIAERLELLGQLVGVPLLVPRIVLDPDEGDVPLAARSELTRGIGVLQRQTADTRQPAERCEAAAAKASRLFAVHRAYAGQLIVIGDMDRTELSLAGRLGSVDHVSEYGNRFPLGLGEAACVAIAISRGCTLVTDDNAGLVTYGRLRPGGPYERTRSVLQRAASDGLLSRTGANQVHSEMTRHGFWDRALPFPDGEND